MTQSASFASYQAHINRTSQSFACILGRASSCNTSKASPQNFCPQVEDAQTFSPCTTSTASCLHTPDSSVAYCFHNPSARNRLYLYLRPTAAARPLVKIWSGICCQALIDLANPAANDRCNTDMASSAFASQSSALEQQQSVLFKLPPELRNRIYEMVFDCELDSINLAATFDPVVVINRKHAEFIRPLKRSAAAPPSTALLRSCQKLYYESVVIFKTALRAYWH